MGDVVEIEPSPTVLALELISSLAEQLATGEVGVLGLMVAWVDEDGLVDYDHTENIGPESVLAMIGPIQVKSSIMLSAEAWEGEE